MKTSVVVTTINKPNKNIKKLSHGSKSNKWDFIVIGDKKSPKKFSLKYGSYFSLKDQKKIKLKFPKICKQNNYARKNIGYLLAIKNKNPPTVSISSLSVAFILIPNKFYII